MNNFHFKKTILFLMLLALSQVTWAACNQTLNSGANLTSAISGATAGSTICLNSGSYPEAALNNVSKSSNVTIQSATGRGATVAFVIKSSNHLKFQNLTINKMDMRNGSVRNSNIAVVNNTFKGQMLVDGSGKSGVNVNILVDGNTFDGINICNRCLTGRLQLWAITGVTITNNHFGGGGVADGILWGGYGGTVGPGNVFEDILQSNAKNGEHIDAIQMNGGPGFVDHGSIVGNYFRNNSAHVGIFDHATSITIKNNVFGPGSNKDVWGVITLFSVEGGSFINNTVLTDWGVRQGAKIGVPTTKNVSYKDNIFVGGKIFDDAPQKGCASGCTYSHNMFASSTNARGSNNIIGKPTFVGGVNPTNWAGYALASKSLGYGLSMGANAFGTTAVAQSSQPSSSGPVSTPLTLKAPSKLRFF